MVAVTIPLTQLSRVCMVRDIYLMEVFACNITYIFILLQALTDFISQEAIDNALLGNASKWTKVTTNLMGELFTESELMTSSCSGTGTSKPALNREKRNALVGMYCLSD